MQHTTQHEGAIGTDKAELERYLGILLTMSLISAPYFRFYWELGTRYELIASAMSRDRFESLKKFLHFNDNTKDKKRDDETRDRLFKIRLLFEMLRQNCFSQKPEEHNSIDEQIFLSKAGVFFEGICPKNLKSGSSRFFQEMDSLEHYMTLNLMVLQTQIKLNKLMKLATMGEILSLDYVCICQRKGISNSILIITSPTQNSC